MLRLSSVSALPLARLEISDEATKGVVAAQCRLLEGAPGSSRQTWRIVAWSLAAACSIVLTAVYGVPLVADRLAPLVPFAVEQRIGDAVDRQVRAIFDGKLCTDEAGQRAFAVMMDKLLAASGLENSIDAHVIASKVPNAFALPGGKIYLLDGLLQKAQSPDEIAGVLGHELGHVQHRDSLRRVIQTGGTSFLIGLLFGDISGSTAVIFVGRTLLDASYSRDAEQSADAFGAAAMRKLGRSGTPMAELLVRITGREVAGASTLLSSHPLSADRLAQRKKEERPNSGAPILTAAEWTALKGICK
jgi:predicted Zn-dependent protease